MKTFRILVLCSGLVSTSHAIPLTYNLKIRRSFNVEPVLKQKKRTLVSAFPIYYARRSHIVDTNLDIDTREHRHIVGSLFNIRYMPSKHIWFEATTGLERDHGEYCGTQTFERSAVGIDDVVLAVGYRAFPVKKMQLVGYGLIGIPTKTDVTLCDRFGAFVGSRIFNVGIGAEISYSLIQSLPRSLSAIAQGRILHGFERSWEPILPEGGQIQPGNVTDILFALQYRQGLTVIEGGYNATFFSNQALLTPAQTLKTDTFVRNSWYGTIYRAKLKSFFQKPFVYGLGFNVSSAHKFDARTFTGWLNLTFVL